MELKNTKVLILAADQFEDTELFYPKIRLTEAGAKVTVAGPKQGETYKGKHGLPITADIGFDKVKVKDYDALIIPGGMAPDKLRKNQKVLEITKEFKDKEKLIAFICHAGWVPISAKVVKGLKCTSYDSIKDDLINAGAKWVDQEVVIDKNFISSRNPNDLPAFCRAIIKYLN